MSSQHPQKTVAIVEWNWTGHHPSYFNNFILALEEMNFDVLAICPKPSEVAALANNTRRNSGADISCRGSTQYLEIAISSATFRLKRSGGIHTIYWTVRFFRSIEHQVREWSRQSGKEVESIFYCCIYDWECQWIHLAQPFLNIPWTGLYLQTRYRIPGSVNPVTHKVPRPKLMFSGRLCTGIAILDEGICKEMSKAIGKPVVVMPDVTDERLVINLEESGLGEQLEGFAAGRPIVGLFGHLGRSKGVMTFLEAAKSASFLDICFALVGEVGWSSEDDKLIKSILEKCPNIWSHLIRIPDGAHLNHVMSKCHVLFAAYLNFPHSSNIMTKAALLEKPLVVSDGYLMAERTRRFNLGEIIPQGNHRALLEAISKITNNPGDWVATNKPQWADYRREHSFDQLKKSLNKLLASG